MTRIAITQAAWEAIAATVDWAAAPPTRSASGKCLIWLPKHIVNTLDGLRRKGEGYSETIMRIVQ
jgi:hypothetical protein